MKNTYDILLREFYAFTPGLKNINDFYIIKHQDEYGVGILNSKQIEIDESFANVSIRSIVIPNKEEEPFKLLALTSSLISHKTEFASFCTHFIDKENRDLITNYPLVWWERWRDLIGNKLSNYIVYDIIAELLTLEKLSKLEKNIQWSGPKGSSLDIETNDSFYEVKSSIVRYENEITISSQFQLEDYSKPSFLIYYKMEELSGGETINKIIERMELSGIINTEEIEVKLSNLGFKKKRSIRNVSYVVHEVRMYNIDDNFPRLSVNMFKNERIPDNIKKISYVVSLDGIKYIDWIR